MSDADDLRAVAQRIAAAIAARDTATLATLVDPGFVHHGEDGRVADAATFMQAVRDVPGVIEFVTLERVDVDVEGDAAMLTGVQAARLTVDGQTIDDRRAFADFFVRRGGSWRLRAAADLEAAPRPPVPAPPA